MTSDHPTKPPGSSAQWDAADQLLFSWLDQPEDAVAARLAALRVSDPALAAAIESRMGRLQRLGHLRMAA